MLCSPGECYGKWGVIFHPPGRPGEARGREERRGEERRGERRGVAWRGVAWRGVAWRGEAVLPRFRKIHFIRDIAWFNHLHYLVQPLTQRS